MTDVLYPYPRKLKKELAKQRLLMSLTGRSSEIDNESIRKNRENWVVMWVDTKNAVSTEDGTATAYRGIDTNGRLMWLVRHVRKRHGYHSLENDPHVALEEAMAAWAARKAVRTEWHFVEQLASDLLTGRRNFAVTLEDAHNSPLCSVGIEAFLRRVRMTNVRRISGRTAALLMKIEPQMGFVIHQAFLRHEEKRPVVAPLY